MQVMSFEIVDQKLNELSASNEELKPKILLIIFYTLRALSDLSETLSSRFPATIKDCIEINVQILTRSCHKGVIEKSSENIGKITKTVS